MTEKFISLAEFSKGLEAFSSEDYGTYTPFGYLLDHVYVHTLHYNIARYR